MKRLSLLLGLTLTVKSADARRLSSSAAFNHGNATLSSPSSSGFTDLRLYPDWEHAPFLAGVMSADPLEDAVLIWTQVVDFNLVSPNLIIYGNTTTTTTINVTASARVEWRFWEKQNAQQSFDRPLQKGTVTALPENNYTITIDVTGLKQGTSYCYQFRYMSTGQKSVLGVTKTIPTESSSITVATMSCTSLWSGYFNFYRHLSQNDEVDVVVHVGDYIYPEVDEQEVNRVPPEGFCGEYIGRYKRAVVSSQGDVDPYAEIIVQEWDCALPNLDIYRQIHMIYHLDPDFRAARARHPFIVAYDNHDLTSYNNDPMEGSRRAFLEWVPQRVVYESPTHVTTLRRFRYGKSSLLDIILFDWAYEQNKEQNGLLGEGQHQWLDEQLAVQPQAQWRLFGSQKTFMPLTVNMVAPWKRELVFLNPTSRTWEGQQGSMQRLFDQLANSGASDNNVWTVGDMHYCYLSDVFRYDPNTLDLLDYQPWKDNVQRFGVEFMPCSGTRGNLDELTSGYVPLLSPGTLPSKALKPLLTAVVMKGNRHFRFFDPDSHGYGTLTFSPTQMIGTIYLFPILNVTDQFTSVTMVARDGVNKWARR